MNIQHKSCSVCKDMQLEKSELKNYSPLTSCSSSFSGEVDVYKKQSGPKAMDNVLSNLSFFKSII